MLSDNEEKDKKRRFIPGRRWYNLPEEVRERLMKLSTGFYTLKDQGVWIYPPVGYEPGVIIVLRTHDTLSYDVFIPAIINMMRDGVLTAVFPSIKGMNIAFYQFDKNNPFHLNAYHRAGLEDSLKEVEDAQEGGEGKR